MDLSPLAPKFRSSQAPYSLTSTIYNRTYTTYNPTYSPTKASESAMAIQATISGLVGSTPRLFFGCCSASSGASGELLVLLK